MAQNTQSKKKKTSGKTAAKSAPKSSGTKRQAPPPEPAPPRRREILGIVFFFAAVFLIISFFNSEGALIVLGTDFIKSLVGYGFWLAAPAFLFCAVILLFHHGRPVAFRVLCILMLPVLFGAMMHVVNVGAPPEDFVLGDVVKSLAQQGKLLASGGVLGGLFGFALYKAFSKAGAFIVLLVIFGLFLIVGTKFDVSGAANKIKDRATRQSLRPHSPCRRKRRLPPPIPSRARSDETGGRWICRSERMRNSFRFVNLMTGRAPKPSPSGHA